MQRDRTSRKRVDRALNSRYNYLSRELCCQLRRKSWPYGKLLHAAVARISRKTPRYGVRGDGSRAFTALDTVIGPVSRRRRVAVDRLVL